MKTKKINFFLVIIVVSIIVILTFSLKSINFSDILTNRVESLFSSTGTIDLKKTNQDSNGSLIDEKAFSELISSNLTGEEYNFNVLYYPYYSLLNSRETLLYKQIYANAKTLNRTFSVSENVNIEEVDETIDAIYYDHPELFWLGNDYTYKYTKDNRVVEITLNFNMTIAEIKEAQQEFNQEVNELLKGAYSLDTAYQKEKYIHNLLINQVTYDEKAPNNQSAYSAIVNKKTVCAGYAKAFQLLLTKLGIPCYYIVGFAKEAHAWNIIKLDGYYNVDLTWDDAKEQYKYFNKTDEFFNKTHTRTGLSQKMASCTATTFQDYEQSNKNNVYNNSNNYNNNSFYNYIYKYGTN